jgi:hypothetical protein
MYTAAQIETIAYRIAFIILHGDTALIKLYLAHVRSLPHGAIVTAVLSMIEDMINE